MELKSFILYFGLSVIPIVCTIENVGAEDRNYFSMVDAVIDNAIDQFEEEQLEKMKSGFTSSAKRSYKKTKYSLAMEARNAIFRNALISLHKQFPEIEEEILSKAVAEKIPSHFDASGAKRSTDTTDEPPFRRELEEACHGFPLHLPGHVEPCRDNVNIQCNEKDNRIRRINGECNNLSNKRWGAQVYPLQRLLPRQNEKFRIPLHDEEQNVEMPVRKTKRGENGDTLVGKWKATVSGTEIDCERSDTINNGYMCSFNGYQAPVTSYCINACVFTWNYGSVTGVITIEGDGYTPRMTWSTGSVWRKSVDPPPPECHSDCSPEDCHESTISLPNARFASATVHSDSDRPEPNVTTLLMQFAQFVDHDISLSPEASTTDCCKNPYQEECMAIMIPENDVYFRQLNNQSCMQFTRSVPYCPENIDSCSKRENMNIISGVLDTSNVYGSDAKTANCLRSFTDGKLLVDENNLLPQSGGFVQAGDARAPEMPGLSTIHALWLREHNRLCDELKLRNPSASDEYLYQNARRILNAEFQNVVYSEQVPIVEGPEAVEKYNLALDAAGTTYDPNVNPSILAEFSTASNRYGHSLVQGQVNVHNNDLSFNHSYELADNFLDATEYNGDGFDAIMAGLTQQASQKFDNFMTVALTRHMFRGKLTPPGSDYGFDLASLNIQRGRDHGLPSYYELYNLIGDKSDPKKDMSCWARKPRSFNQANWDLLKKIYKHPRDIELFSGGLLDERPNGINANPILGVMFSAINAIQFQRLKDGDRFFFTHTNGAAGFDLDARTAIMERKMSDIICDNTRIQRVPRNAFLPATITGIATVPDPNELIDCGEHNRLDLARINLINV